MGEDGSSGYDVAETCLLVGLAVISWGYILSADAGPDALRNACRLATYLLQRPTAGFLTYTVLHSAKINDPVPIDSLAPYRVRSHAEDCMFCDDPADHHFVRYRELAPQWFRRFALRKINHRVAERRPCFAASILVVSALQPAHLIARPDIWMPVNCKFVVEPHLMEAHAKGEASR